MRNKYFPPRLDYPNNISEGYILRSSSLSSLVQPLSTSSLLGPNILLSTLFSDTLNLCHSLSLRYKVSHPLKKQKNKLPRILILKFLREDGKTCSELNGNKHSPNLIRS
jgi:hypothetical protein